MPDSTDYKSIITHAFSLNPSTKLLSRWLEAFEILVNDQEYQRKSCQDVLHKIFLHQAVLNVLLVTLNASRR